MHVFSKYNVWCCRASFLLDCCLRHKIWYPLTSLISSLVLLLLTRAFSLPTVILPIILICAGLGLAALAAAAFGSALTSSGRGLDTDEWVVDHSVWMSQLQKDFEDSWSTE